jgi:glycerol-3-phosphate dehydrogenase subunit C
MEAKTQFIQRDGLKFGIRTIEDVERIANLCGTYPRLTNYLFRTRSTSRLLKAAIGIHKSRNLPEFPKENFPMWAKKHMLTVKDRRNPKHKLAYFAGCTGKFLFPDVAKAVVDVFRNNGFEIYYPDQKCCGMPSLLEGDNKLTLKFVRFNVNRLYEAVEEGYDIVCSCPTCSYMLKDVLKERAYYSQEYQEMVNAHENSFKIPITKSLGNLGERKYEFLPKSIYKAILKDDGYFSSISPLKRIKVAENTYDMEEYLLYLHKQGELSLNFGPVPDRMVYYPPCHLREQKIGMPYIDLLKIIPGITLEAINGQFYCCGVSGIMGFKREFHDTSIQLGSIVMNKIRDMDPEKLVTDCLSCRLQFNQLLPYDVLHPIEILIKSYNNYRG